VLSIEANDSASICEKDEIHLLDVQPGSGSRLICCTFTHVRIFGSVKMKHSPTITPRDRFERYQHHGNVISFEKYRVSHTSVSGRGQPTILVGRRLETVGRTISTGIRGNMRREAV
jgi:hypothetical protein